MVTYPSAFPRSRTELLFKGHEHCNYVASRILPGDAIGEYLRSSESSNIGFLLDS